MPTESNTPGVPEKTPEKKHIGRRRILFISAAAAILIPVLLLALAVSTRTGFPRPEMTPEDWSRQSRVTMTLMQQILDRQDEKYAQITLSPRDVRALLHFAVNYDQFAAMLGRRGVPDETVQWLADYDDEGRFFLTYRVPVPGGLSFILQGNATGRYGRNLFSLSPENCRIGRLPVPGWAIRPFLPYILARLDRNRYVRIFHRTVETVEPDEKHNLIVTYQPDMARTVRGKGF